MAWTGLAWHNLLLWHNISGQARQIFQDQLFRSRLNHLTSETDLHLLFQFRHYIHKMIDLIHLVHLPYLKLISHVCGCVLRLLWQYFRHTAPALQFKVMLKHWTTYYSYYHWLLGTRLVLAQKRICSLRGSKFFSVSVPNQISGMKRRKLSPANLFHCFLFHFAPGFKICPKVSGNFLKIFEFPFSSYPKKEYFYAPQGESI